MAPREISSIVLRLVGDSGDGMQITGTQITETSALMGNDLCTFPDYPSEIRAPVGTLAGVSGFQVKIAAKKTFTHGDVADILVVMNPAALKASLQTVRKGGIILCDSSAFTEKNFAKIEMAQNPLEDGSLSDFVVVPCPMTELTLKAVADVGLGHREAVRCKNFFALGILYYLLTREKLYTERWIATKFATKPELALANLKALNAGFLFAQEAEQMPEPFVIPKAPMAPGEYRYITGNEAAALGLMAASEKSGLKLFLGSYPITPASDILHQLAQHAAFGVRVFQAEDEIAGVCSAIGAAFAGALACTTTSGPGLSLKTEGLGLAVMLELPLVVIDVQRGGPSTGLPTKTEQADLLQVLFGRSGECPLPVIAACDSGDCFWTAIEAARIAVRHMTPVVMLSDGYIANGAAAWPIPDMAKIPEIPVHFHTDPETFHPYSRDENGARPWAIPGTPYLEHRVGGLEKRDVDGSVCHAPENHQKMCELRAAKVEKVADFIPPCEIFGAREGGKLLVLGWGGTFGAIRAAVTEMREQGYDVSHLHLRHLNPFPRDLKACLAKFEKVLLPELNFGQLALLIRGKLGIDVESFCKLQGKPFKEAEIEDAIRRAMEVKP